MPAPALARFADKVGMSMDDAEHHWEKAKDIIQQKYKFSKKNPRYWALVMGTTKKMMGVKEDITFSEFLEATQLAQLDEEVVSAHFGKDTLGMKMPSGFDKFKSKQKGGKAWALIGVKSNGDEKEVKIFPSKELADQVASEFNDALSAANEKPEKISMLQAFGSHAMNVLHDAGINFVEKPDYWEDLDKPSGNYKPLHEVAFKKVEKELAKIDVKLKTYTSKELWGRDPKHPLESPKEMPSEQVFVVKLANGNRYLADKTGARTYIRMWAKIV